METLGQVLRSAREQKGLSMLDAEKATKIRVKLLAALEEGTYASLPPRLYVKGMVRTYAEYLGLEVASALNRLEAELGPETGYRIQPINKPLRRPTVITARFFVSLIVLISASVLFYYFYREYSQFVNSGGYRSLTASPAAATRAAAVAPTSTPLPTSTPEPTATPWQGITLETRMTDRSWLRVIVDDKTVYEGILAAGETRTWTGKDKVVVRAGNAGGVDIVFNGKKLGLMGSRGEVVEKQWTRPEAPSP